jgi:hypothetical protein
MTITAIIKTYRGIDQGWQQVTTKTTKKEADRFLSLLNKVRPDYNNKMIISHN